MTATLEQKLENRVGPLADTIPQFQPGTLQTSAEITKERVINRKLRKQMFYTVNFSMYTVEDVDGTSTPFLYFGGRTANPIFNDPQEACKQLIKTDNYKPNRESIDAVVASVASGDTTKVKLSDLRLNGDNAEWKYIEIDTTDYAELNDAEKKFAAVGYGSMDVAEGKEKSDFDNAMAMLREEGVAKTKMFVLSLDYVQKNAPKNGALARACWLGNTDSSSCINADNRSVSDHDALRGVPLVVAAEGGAPQKAVVNPIVAAYQTLFAQEKDAVAQMTSEIAAGLSNLVTSYLKRQAK